MLTSNAKINLEQMNGYEIQTDKYETQYGIVGVRDNKVIDCGKEIDILNTSKKVNSLYRDFIKQELF